MKRLAIVLLLCPVSSFGQATRATNPVQTINQSNPQPGGMYPVLALPNSIVTICNAPAMSGSVPAKNTPCTNYATTYTSQNSGVACPSNAQLTRDASTSCIANADAQGQWGAWLLPGCYQYTITVSYGTSGPYDFCASSISTGTAANPAGPAYAVNFANSGVNAFQGDPTITINPANHSLSTAQGALGSAVNVTQFNVVPDSQLTWKTDLSFNSTTSVSSASTTFASTDVGKTIVIQGAGANQTNLTTTIASLVNATTVILAAAASVSTGSGYSFLYGTDNGTAMNAAVASNKNLIFPPGVGILVASPIAVGIGIPHLTIDLNGSTLIFATSGGGACSRQTNGLFQVFSSEGSPIRIQNGTLQATDSASGCIVNYSQLPSGNPGGSGDGYSHGLYLRDVHFLGVNDSNIARGTNTMSSVWSVFSGEWRVEHNIFEGYGATDFIATGSSNQTDIVNITHNSFQGNYRHDPHINIQNPEALTLDNNNFEVSGVAISGSGAVASSVTNNWFGDACFAQVSSTISTLGRSGSVVTVVYSTPHHMITGDYATFENITLDPTMNGLQQVTVVNTNTVTFNQAGTAYAQQAAVGDSYAVTGTQIDMNLAGSNGEVTGNFMFTQGCHSQGTLIALSGGASYHVAGNNLSSAAIGVSASGSARGHINENVFANFTTNVQLASAGVTVEGNTFGNGTTGVALLAGAVGTRLGTNAYFTTTPVSCAVGSSVFSTNNSGTFPTCQQIGDVLVPGTMHSLGGTVGWGSTIPFGGVGVNYVTASGTAAGMTPGTYALSFSVGGVNCTGEAGTITVTSATAYNQPVVTAAGSGCTSVPTATAATGGTPPTLAVTLLTNPGVQIPTSNSLQISGRLNDPFNAFVTGSFSPSLVTQNGEQHYYSSGAPNTGCWTISVGAGDGSGNGGTLSTKRYLLLCAQGSIYGAGLFEVDGLGNVIFSLDTAGISFPHIAPGTGSCLQISSTGAITPTGIPCGSGTGAVSSVFGRTGVVVAGTGDYNFGQISGTLTLAQLATEAADSWVANATGSTASPTAVSIPNCAIGITYSTSTHTFGCASSSGISGLTAGFIPLAGSATTITGNSPLDYNVTNAGEVTSSAPLVIAGSTHGVTIPGGSPATGAANAATFSADSSGNGTVAVGTGAQSIICTVANYSSNCPGSGSGDTITTPNNTLIVGGTSTNTTVDLNLAHSNTFSANQGIATPVASAIANSPTFTLSGVYESAATPTYAADNWAWLDTVGTGVNGTSSFSLTHTGSTGAASVSIPYTFNVGAVLSTGQLQAASGSSVGWSGRSKCTSSADGAILCTFNNGTTPANLTLGTYTGAQFIGTGSTPTCVMGPAAGSTSGASCTSITGTNTSGRITLTTGTGTTSSAVLATITWGGTLASAPNSCPLVAVGTNANGQVTMVSPAYATTTGMTINVAGSAVPISTAYTYSYGPCI